MSHGWQSLLADAMRKSMRHPGGESKLSKNRGKGSSSGVTQGTSRPTRREKEKKGYILVYSLPKKDDTHVARKK